MDPHILPQGENMFHQSAYITVYCQSQHTHTHTQVHAHRYTQVKREDEPQAPNTTYKTF